MTFSTNKLTKLSTNNSILQKLVLAMAGTALLVTSSAVFAPTASANSRCTRQILGRLKKSNPGRYNYMVFNRANSHSKNLRGLARQGSDQCGGRIYDYWIFRSGTFSNNGDMGYTNWAFSGRFKRTGRDGRDVTFYRRR